MHRLGSTMVLFGLLAAAPACGSVVGADLDGWQSRPGSPDTTSDAGAVADPPIPPNADGTCPDDRKKCGELCVSRRDSAYGCEAESCEPCSAAHGTAACSADGACVVGVCEESRADCNDDPSDGCEVDTSSSHDHCGACGKPCAADRVCSNGACAVSCAGGKSACGGSCVDLKTDSKHCGDCATACPVPTNGSAVCNAGTCAVTCKAGYGTCPATGPTVCVKLETFYRDLDNDGYGGTTTIEACTMPTGYVGLTGDCHDGNPNVHPNQTQEFTTPYVMAGSTSKSFDYDCSGAEETSGTSLSCDDEDAECDSSNRGLVCVNPTSGAGRPAGANLTCGGEAFQCIRTSAGGYEWDSNLVFRPCR